MLIIIVASMSKTQHNQEAVANTVLAQLLRQRDLNAQAETVVGHKKPDIIITREHDDARIYLETEYKPYATRRACGGWLISRAISVLAPRPTSRANKSPSANLCVSGDLVVLFAHGNNQ